jgi:F0F1-type ATP synthase delta subunit
MNDSTLGRNYAETLLILAKKQGEQEEWGALIDDLAVAMQEDRTL